MKPIIALTADSLIDHSAVINQHDADMAPTAIKEAIVAAGGIPIILPFSLTTEPDEAQINQLVDLFDGLLLPGGPDVDPTFFGEEPIPQIGRTAYRKDAFEIALIKKTRAVHKPIFAICRGIQVYNVACGGTLYQDLATQDTAYAIRHAQAAPGNFPTHHVRIAQDSRLAKLLGNSSYVNSRHHQAVKQPAPGLRVVAQAADGVIEALESINDDSFLGVQWHPENMWQVQKEQFAFFADLVARAAAN
ncbi:MAG: gamma-glutamyl-gamma-aminobutyrate hydrolase family protein [Liquorilactobacillus nagelii]|uniref:Gamma-glutamyl-gamma-aminobutyrate hydrolase n=1 Tax=Liquorilactobacillus nagelii TaxID=82688 RepID=A0A3S6R2S2_9LACO|nr:gamma-glutamyl-gamma-aminobutyrate hydrolase family protein [Liquorilactobacillus nagelii]AUJ32855.1 gamma-glutamyl-gamma-aminobutyrate hydrolase [Liquorilactobacillus nagelii]MCC7616400.1 gamma-glutamyl-gamma-aminobutyrate hydrolase [Liquorilactobacillus nagelii]MCP9315158.1 gamma-glutamyl-gamma-aminobutyrate hydrolase family protein [Liquorilactobacillus nagelii]